VQVFILCNNFDILGEKKIKELIRIPSNVGGQMKFLEARSQQSEHKTKLQFGASLCG
jgi:hypothetical protein